MLRHAFRMRIHIVLLLVYTERGKMFKIFYRIFCSGARR